MSEELNKLLKKIVNDETYNYIQDHYDILKNESIISAGIDSLEYISILSELDETYGFDEEMIDSLETFSDVERLFDGK